MCCPVWGRGDYSYQFRASFNNFGSLGVYVCIHSLLSSIHGFRVVPHVGYMGTVPLKGMPFNDGRIGKIVGLGINLYFSKEF